MNVDRRSMRARRRAAGVMLLVWLAGTLAPVRSARACDVCAVYTATEMGEARKGFRLGIAEQYTHFSTLQDDGHEIDNVAKERIDSAITQVQVGYGITPRFAVQLTLPIISRQFRRLHDGRVEHGDESGVGDLSLIGSLLAYSDVSADTVFRFSVLGGLKLPSGDSSRIAEELEEGHHHEHEGEHAVSGVHGHDLALGSGSVDGIIGASAFWSWRRFFLTAATQFAIRGEGDFGYQYAHDLTWLGGPGFFALLGHQHTLGVQAVLSGETKGKDTLNGVRADDTGITSLYVGPGVTFTWGTSLAADVALDVPVVQDNTSVQLVPDYRVRGGVTWRF